jgi:mRNA-degrading endonuclease toxin of MazEF toxin-antitoxin module
MTGFEFGDLILVRFPFTDHTTSKQRPAAVISSAAYHRARADLLIMPSAARFALDRIRGGGNPRLEGGRATQALGNQAGHRDCRGGLIRRTLGRLRRDDLNALRAVLDSITGP